MNLPLLPDPVSEADSSLERTRARASYAKGLALFLTRLGSTDSEEPLHMPVHFEEQEPALCSATF